MIAKSINGVNAGMKIQIHIENGGNENESKCIS